MSKLRVLHIALNAPNEPNHGIEKGFINNDVNYSQIDWISFKSNFGLSLLQEHIIETCRMFKPNIVFMQVQTPAIIQTETIKEISEDAFIVNWTGDVREDVSWYKLFASFVDVTLFTNITDVRKMYESGFKNTDYLQIGYDSDIYRKLNRKAPYPPIVFLGNNYNNHFPLSHERSEMVTFLKREFNGSFQNYGGAWVGTRKLLPNDEVVCYNSCKIAINQNHFDYERFSSDRIFRIMASGAFCLTKYYKGIELEFNIGEHLDVWYNFDELKSKINYYLNNEDKRIKIANAGRELVTTKYNWTERVKQLFEVSKKYDYKNKLVTNNNWIDNITIVDKFKKYSQHHDEGYIGYIMNNIGNCNYFFVDLGAGGGGNEISNTKYFLEIGYNGLLIDADNTGLENVKQEWLTKENICEILEKYECPKEFDLLSIDLDGNDYYILDSLLEKYQPRLIIAEINSIFDIEESMVIDYNPSHLWVDDDYYGMSLGAAKKLAKKHNYSIIFQNQNVNAYLVRNDLIEGGKEPELNYQKIQVHKHNDYAKWIEV